MFEKSVDLNLADAGYFLRVRRGACLDKAHIFRLSWFSEAGFPRDHLTALGLDARVMADTINYFDDVAVLETLTANLALSAISDDGNRMKLVSNFSHQDGSPALQVSTEIVWFAQNTGLPCGPPNGFQECLRNLPLEAELETLPSCIK